MEYQVVMSYAYSSRLLPRCQAVSTRNTLRDMESLGGYLRDRRGLLHFPQRPAIPAWRNGDAHRCVRWECGFDSRCRLRGAPRPSAANDLPNRADGWTGRGVYAGAGWNFRKVHLTKCVFGHTMCADEPDGVGYRFGNVWSLVRVQHRASVLLAQLVERIYRSKHLLIIHSAGPDALGYHC